jgi:RNA ligase
MNAVHPVQRYDFDTLTRELQARADAGLVRVVPNGDMRLYVYSQRCVYDRAWDEFTELARGLVLDVGRRRVLARPFPKFFNYGERSAAIPDEPFEVFEKVDGSLGIVFHDGERWRCCTKGSFEAEQAKWAERWLSGLDRWLMVGVTYLFEIVYHANRIVVRYPGEGLILLGAYDADGEEWTGGELDDVAAWLGTRCARRHEFTAIEDAIAHAAELGTDAEGFVVRFASGLRLKIKGSAYLRIHRAISRTTPLGVWEMMAAGDDLDVARREIPEECWEDFDAIRELLTTKLAAVVGATEAEAANWEGRSDKDVGLALQSVPEPARQFIFPRRKLGAAWTADPRVRAGLHRLIRPSRNELDGYTPGRLMAALAQDDA